MTTMLHTCIRNICYNIVPMQCYIKMGTYYRRKLFSAVCSTFIVDYNNLAPKHCSDVSLVLNFQAIVCSVISAGLYEKRELLQEGFLTVYTVYIAVSAEAPLYLKLYAIRILGGGFKAISRSTSVKDTTSELQLFIPQHNIKINHLPIARIELKVSELICHIAAMFPL